MEQWIEANKELTKTFHFKSYLKAIGFVNAIAWHANKVNHHPDIIVSFNKCIVKLTTHDQGGITQQDREMARVIDELFA